MNPIVVIGEALVDRLPDGPVAGGAPFNVARSLAALGVPVHFISRIGADDDGKRVLDSASFFKLVQGGIQRDAVHATGAVTVHAEGPQGHSFEIHDNAAWDHLDSELALQHLPQAEPAVLYFGTLAQRHSTARQSIRTLLESLAAARSVPTQPALRYLDLNLRSPFAGREVVAQSLALADWVKVNDEELAQVLTWFVPDAPALKPTQLAAHLLNRFSDLHSALQTLMRQFSLQRIIITLGALGWASCNAQGQCDHTGPAVAVGALADTVGAGDAFSAMLLAARYYAKPLPEALALAAGFAAAMCEQRGPMVHSMAYFVPWRTLLQAPQHTPVFESTPQGTLL